MSIMELSEFVSLEGEDFADQFGWVDWRQDDAAVIEMFRSQLGDSASIEYVEERGDITVQYRGRSYSIPLTHTGCDRYVVLSSLAELLRETHDVWLHKASMEDDTHGVLVLSRSFSRELAEKHASWVKESLQPLRRGIDEFTGLKIPYIGHERRKTEFEKEYRALEAARTEREAEVRKLALESTAAVRKYKLKQYVSLTIAVLVLSLIAWGLVLKHSEPDCRIRVDGECIDQSAE